MGIKLENAIFECDWCGTTIIVKEYSSTLPSGWMAYKRISLDGAEVCACEECKDKD